MDLDAGLATRPCYQTTPGGCNGKTAQYKGLHRRQDGQAVSCRVPCTWTLVVKGITSEEVSPVID